MESMQISVTMMDQLNSGSGQTMEVWAAVVQDCPRGLLPASALVLEQIAALATAEKTAPECTTPRPPAPLPDRSVQLAPYLSPGVVLAESPAVLGPGRALVLVWDISQNLMDIHGNEDWKARGFVVNRPFPHTVAEVTRRTDLGRLGGVTLFHGGSVGSGSKQGEAPSLFVLHRQADIEGAAPVMIDENGAGVPGGLYIGGSLAEINARLESEVNQPADFKVILGSHELALAKSGESGDLGFVDPNDDSNWVMVHGPGSDDAAMLPPQFDTTGLFRDGKGLGPEDVVEGYNHARFWHQNLAWSQLMRALSRDAEAAARYQDLAAVSDLHPAAAVVVAGSFPLSLRVVDFDGADSCAEGGGDWSAGPAQPAEIEVQATVKNA
jgi:predicted pyridoxine 5'-phosphate oxidase superfamily flavin-nucleotide-binding protein